MFLTDRKREGRWAYVGRVQPICSQKKKYGGKKELLLVFSLASVFFASNILFAVPGCFVRFNPQNRSWTIANRLISLTYHFDGTKGALQLASLEDIRDGQEWAGNSHDPVFHFQYTAEGSGSQAIDSRSGWRLEGWNKSALGGNREEVVIRLANAKAQMSVELHAECAQGYPVIRRWYQIENRSGGKRMLSDAAIVSDPVTWADSIKVLTYKFDTHGTFLQPISPEVKVLSGSGFEKLTGSVAYSPVMMLRTDQARGLFWGWAYSGPSYFGIRTKPGANSGLVEVSFQSLRSQVRASVLSYQLGPGKAFKTPEQFVGVYKGGWDEACYLMQRYADRWFSGITHENPQYPLAIIDSWGAYSIHEASLKKGINWAAKAGLDAMDIDYGWAIAGDWKPRRQFFSSGSIKGLSDYARRKGIKLIVHLPFGDVDHDSELYRRHRDWTYGKSWKLWTDEKGRQGTASSLCLTNEAARNWMVNRVSKTMTENGLDGFDPDAFVFTPENIPCPFLSGDASKAAPAYSQYVFGLDRFLEELLKRDPGLVIENAGGGLGPPVYDFSIAQWFAHTISTVAIPIAQRVPEYIRANYYITYLVSPRWPAEYFSPTAKANVGILTRDNSMRRTVKSPGRLRLNDFCLRIFLLGGSFYLELNPAKSSPRGQALLIKYIRMFKQLRTWTSSGEVLHLMSPGPAADWNGWAALGDYNPGNDRAIVIVWHYQGNQNKMIIPMKALKPDHRYAVQFTDSGRKYIASGREIMSDGFHLFLDPYAQQLSNKSSEIILINAVGNHNAGSR